MSAGITVPTTTRSKPSRRTAIQQSGATHPAARATAAAGRPVVGAVLSVASRIRARLRTHGPTVGVPRPSCAYTSISRRHASITPVFAAPLA